MAPKTFLILFTFLTLVDSGQAQESVPRGNDLAKFEFFEYEGRDAVFDVSLNNGEYFNPILAGSYPDPSITRVGDDFYLAFSSFGFVPGLPVFRSKNLIHWELAGHVIDRAGMFDFTGVPLSRYGIWGPTIEFHEGRFIVASTCNSCGGNFIVTATDPAGPWSDPVWLTDVDGFDPMLYFEGDRAWLLNHGEPPGGPQYRAHGSIWIREVDPITFSSISEPTLLLERGSPLEPEPRYVEGPHIYRKGDHYYLSAAEGGTGVNHRQVIFRSQNLLGPYEPFEGNPILTQADLPADRPDPITATGHADLVDTPGGDWWAVFLGIRPYNQDNDYISGRETFLAPVEWQSGWPVILPPGTRLPYVNQGPGLPAPESAPAPMSGNFIDRDEFDAPLGPAWLFIKEFGDEWHEVVDGRLSIHPLSVGLGDEGAPSLVARRIQHRRSLSTASLDLPGTGARHEAGLMLFRSDLFYIAIGLTRTERGDAVLRIRRRAGAEDPARGVVLTELPVPGQPGDSLKLRAELIDDRLEVAFAPGDESFRFIEQAIDAGILSPQRTWDFFGAFVGLYAESGP